MRVCWAPEDGGASVFYEQAGTLSFDEPFVMFGVSLQPITQGSDTVAPIAIVIRFNRLQKEYERTVGEVYLTLRFRDVGSKVEPRLWDGSAPNAICIYVHVYIYIYMYISLYIYIYIYICTFINNKLILY